MESSPWLIVIITLLFSAFFSGMEIAFVSSNKLKIELEKKRGIISARVFSFFLKNQGSFISTMLVGNNIALVIYGIFIALILEPPLAVFISSSFIVFLLQTIISTLLILVTAEFLPKVLFRIDPNKTLSFFALPTVLFYIILFPLVRIITICSNWILRVIMKQDVGELEVSFGKVDLDHFVKEATDSMHNKEEIENEVQIFQNALDFSELRVRECMIPRTEVIALEENESIEVLKKTLTETGLSKILIYREDIDNIIGYVHSFELLKKPKTIKNILLPVSLIPEAMSANEAMSILIKNKRSIAVVLDEFGGTAGILSTEDIIEELVGEIEDEHDKEEYTENVINDEHYQFSARLEIDYLNENYNLTLPSSEEYETLGGLIINASGSIPEKGEVINIAPYKFEILIVEENKIDLIDLRIVETDT
ncbi:hemolysin family protein [Salibacteraceae bacterium]|jgi:putative hemolysin|nr:hemolysin family protein [Salibacteraceae bacterium]MDB9725582.1 hemolysin family protein [Salibacteraceae bacterium]